MSAGVVLIVVGSVAGAITALVLWHRLPGAIALSLTTLSGACVGAGGLLVQDDVGSGSWVLTLAALAVLTPVHSRLLFGRPGPPDRVVAPGTAAA